MLRLFFYVDNNSFFEPHILNTITENIFNNSEVNVQILHTCSNIPLKNTVPFSKSSDEYSSVNQELFYLKKKYTNKRFTKGN